MRINFGNYCVAGGCQAQLWGENGTLCVYFRQDGKFFIEDRGNRALCWIVKEWAELKDSMNRMIAYGITECNKANLKKLEAQKEKENIINGFRL